MKSIRLFRRKIIAPLGAMLLSSYTVPTHAADDEIFFDMPIVLSANRLEQPLADAAVSVSVIDRETIEASGARTIPEVLRLIPGMQVGYSGNEFGGEPQYVVAYHGHSDEFSKQMQVLIDGRSIYEPFFGGISWQSIPVNLNDIERIEVSRGPNVATYGANSFQAAINIITRTAAEDQGTFIQGNAGNNNIADLTLRYGGSNGDLDYRVTASTLNDDGLDSGNDFDYPDDRNSNNIDYRLDYQLDNNNTLSYQGGYGENRQQTDRNHDGSLPLQRTVENTRFFQFLKWENAIDQDNSILLQYYYNLSDKKDIANSDTFDFSPLPLDPFVLDIDGSIKSERHNLEFTHFLQADESLKIIWGLSAQADIVTAPLYLGRDDRVLQKQFRGFANAEWHIDQDNIVNIGALAENNDVSDSELSPRLSFTHAFNRQHHVRVGISKAIRSPFVYEANANLRFRQELTVGGAPAPSPPFPGELLEQQIMGNMDLENEKIISREIAYFGDFMNSALLFNARLFHDDITDYIDTVREPTDPAIGDNVPDDVSQLGNPTATNTVRVFRNPLESTTTGLELELDYHIDSTLRLIASGAIININSNSNAISISAPQHSYSFITTKNFNEKYSGSLAYYFVEAFRWTDARGGTDDYQTLDLRLSRSFRTDNTNGSLSIVLKNLLGDYSDYQENPSNSTAPKVEHSMLAFIDFRLNF